MQNTDLADRLAATAAGTWGEEAAVWLLAEHAHWLPELERCELIDTVPWGGTGEMATIVNWERVNVTTSKLVGTQSEWRVLRIAGALGGAQPTQMYDLTSLDEDNRRLVLHAVAWAAGGRDWAKSLGLLRGLRCGTCQRSLTGLPGKEAIAHIKSHKTADQTS